MHACVGQALSERWSLCIIAVVHRGAHMSLSSETYTSEVPSISRANERRHRWLLDAIPFATADLRHVTKAVEFDEH